MSSTFMKVTKLKRKQSLCYRFLFARSEKTLNDKQIDKIMSKLIYRFENELNAVIRK